MPRKRRSKKRYRSLRNVEFGRPRIELEDRTKRWIVIIAFLTLGTLGILSLLDLAGTFGVYFSALLTSLFGALSWLGPIVLLGLGYLLLRPNKYELHFSHYFGIALTLLGFSALLHLALHSDQLWQSARQGQGGGYFGVALAAPLYRLMGFWAAILVLFAVTAIGVLVLANRLLARPEGDDEVEDDEDESDEDVDEYKQTFFGKLRNVFLARGIRKLQRQKEEHANAGGSDNVGDQDEADEQIAAQLGFSEREVSDSDAEENDQEELGDEQIDSDQSAAAKKSHEVKKYRQVQIDMPLDLLTNKIGIPNGGDLKANMLIIKKTFAQFGVKVEMGDAQVGPTVTQYTLKPAEGVRLSKILGLTDNLALALAAHPIRIEAPIPGKSLVGIEVPNQATAVVPLRQVLDSEEFRTRPSNTMIVLGADVMGKPWLADLAKMPHLLIAGATGSGKSVCINILIQTLLFQNGPGELKFIMVDPKRVELPGYNGIPHLLSPVITDVKKTINALRWTVAEMERRFEVLAAAGKRNIQAYNEGMKERLPYIVFVIDELADLMASSAADVEHAIIRLAQMSRAVGIHLVLATQRPSVDVITGLIKANVPARIAFSVASLTDSRTILDASGAEKLLGRGDMLYVSAEMSKPKRLQGAYASDDDIKNVIDHLKKEAEPEYLEEVVEKQNGSGLSSDGDDMGSEGDPLLEEAKDVVFQAKKASASLLQRRLRVGYARAARLLDLLEERGYIGPGEGAKPREVMLDRFNVAPQPSRSVKPAIEDTVDDEEEIDNEEEELEELSEDSEDEDLDEESEEELDNEDGQSDSDDEDSDDSRLG